MQVIARSQDNSAMPIMMNVPTYTELHDFESLDIDALTVTVNRFYQRTSTRPPIEHYPTPLLVVCSPHA